MATINFLSQLWGFIFIFFSLALLINIKLVNEVFDIADDKKILTLFGFIGSALGIFLILSYSVWDNVWHSLVSLIHVMPLAKGIMILFFPKATHNLIHSAKKSGWLSLILLVLIIIGCFLVYAGFTL